MSMAKINAYLRAVRKARLSRNHMEMRVRETQASAMLSTLTAEERTHALRLAFTAGE